MNGIRINTARGKTIRPLRYHGGYTVVVDSVPFGGCKKGQGREEQAPSAISGGNGACGSLFANREWPKMIKGFGELFRKKIEEAMQERAEKSRKKEDVEDQFDETTRNLDHLLNEISKKKNHG
jgi:hypothetical protein